MKPSCTCAEGRPQPDPKVGVVTVIPRTTFTFHGSTAGVPPPPTVIPLRMRIDTSEWTSGVMLVRLHDKNFPSTTSYAEVEAYNDGFTPEDPTMNFTDELATRGSTTISNGAAAGTLYPVNTVQPLASMMRVDLRFYQGSTTLGVSSLTLSVVLVGRKQLRPIGPGMPQPSCSCGNQASGENRDTENSRRLSAGAVDARQRHPSVAALTKKPGGDTALTPCERCVLEGIALCDAAWENWVKSAACNADVDDSNYLQQAKICRENAKAISTYCSGIAKACRCPYGNPYDNCEHCRAAAEALCHGSCTTAACHAHCDDAAWIQCLPACRIS